MRILLVLLGSLTIAVAALAHEAPEPHEHPSTPPPAAQVNKDDRYTVMFVRGSSGRMDMRRFNTLLELAHGIANEKNDDTRLIVVFRGKDLIDSQVIPEKHP